MNEKKIEDYMHHYLGCEVLVSNKIETLVHVGLLGNDSQRFHTIQKYQSFTNEWKEDNKLILRTLSSMTQEERDIIDFEYGSGSGNLSDSLMNEKLYQLRIEDTFEITRYLLSSGFDIFGLIEAGVAIDKSKLEYKQVQ